MRTLLIRKNILLALALAVLFLGAAPQLFAATVSCYQNIIFGNDAAGDYSGNFYAPCNGFGCADEPGPPYCPGVNAAACLDWGDGSSLECSGGPGWGGTSMGTSHHYDLYGLVYFSWSCSFDIYDEDCNIDGQNYGSGGWLSPKVCVPVSWADDDCNAAECAGTDTMHQIATMNNGACAPASRCNGACTSCSCGGSSYSACGGGGCGPTERRETRSCSPSGCQWESKCTADVSCIPTGTMGAIPAAITNRITSAAQPVGTVAGTASASAGVSKVEVVIRRGPNPATCNTATHKDWNGSAWVDPCTAAGVLSTALSSPGAASTNWSLASTPLTSDMTSGDHYRVYMLVTSMLGNTDAPAWGVSQETTLSCADPAFPGAAWTDAGCNAAPCALTEKRFNATNTCGFAISRCADNSACYHNFCGPLGSTCTRIGGAASSDCTTPGFRGAAPAGCGFPAPACTLTASPDHLITPPNNKSSTLAWNCTDVVACAFVPNIAPVPVVGNNAAGSATVTPTSTTTYDLNCSGADGSAITTRATVDVQVFMFDKGVLIEVKPR